MSTKNTQVSKPKIKKNFICTIKNKKEDKKKINGKKTKKKQQRQGVLNKPDIR